MMCWADCGVEPKRADEVKSSGAREVLIHEAERAAA